MRNPCVDVRALTRTSPTSGVCFLVPYLWKAGRELRVIEIDRKELMTDGKNDQVGWRGPSGFGPPRDAGRASHRTLATAVGLRHPVHLGLDLGVHHYEPARGLRRMKAPTNPASAVLRRSSAPGRVLRLSRRQVCRLLVRYRADGVAALVDGNRGRVPVNRTDPSIRARLVELATTEFAGFNPVHLAELLAEEATPIWPSRRLRRAESHERGPIPPIGSSRSRRRSRGSSPPSR